MNVVHSSGIIQFPIVVTFQLVWLNPSVMEHTVSWDSTMCLTYTVEAETKRLMTKAFKEALTPEAQQQLATALSDNPDIVYHIGLTPKKV